MFYAWVGVGVASRAKEFLGDRVGGDRIYCEGLGQRI